MSFSGNILSFKSSVLFHLVKINHESDLSKKGPTKHKQPNN